MTITGQILTRARELITDPAHWGQAIVAANAEGHEVPVLEATCFCAAGAICRAERELEASTNRFAAYLALGFQTGYVLGQWNDDPTTTHADVLAAFDQAIAKCN